MNKDAGAYDLSRLREYCHVTTCMMKFADGKRNVAYK